MRHIHVGLRQNKLAALLVVAHLCTSSDGLKKGLEADKETDNLGLDLGRLRGGGRWADEAFQLADNVMSGGVAFNKFEHVIQVDAAEDMSEAAMDALQEKQLRWRRWAANPESMKETQRVVPKHPVSLRDYYRAFWMASEAKAKGREAAEMAKASFLLQQQLPQRVQLIKADDSEALAPRIEELEAFKGKVDQQEDAWKRKSELMQQAGSEKVEMLIKQVLDKRAEADELNGALQQARSNGRELGVPDKMMVQLDRHRQAARFQDSSSASAESSAYTRMGWLRQILAKANLPQVSMRASVWADENGLVESDMLGPDSGAATDELVKGVGLRTFEEARFRDAVAKTKAAGGTGLLVDPVAGTEFSRDHDFDSGEPLRTEEDESVELALEVQRLRDSMERKVEQEQQVSHEATSAAAKKTEAAARMVRMIEARMPHGVESLAAGGVLASAIRE